MDNQNYWNEIYKSKAPNAVSWYSPHLEKSLELITKAANKSASIIDIGGGASTLVDDLVALKYLDVTVLDISKEAIDVAEKRLGPLAGKVRWKVADVTTDNFPKHAYDVWHDRAVFHFLTTANDRSAYVNRVVKSVKPGGHVIIATFGLGGPEKCSGLFVERYDSSSLHNEFGNRFKLIESANEEHETPFGTTQQFLYCYCKLD